MTFWTDETESALRAHWAAGLTATRICEEIGAPTRNAVLGKIHRMGLQREQTGATIIRFPRPPKPARKPKVGRIEYRAVPLPDARVPRPPRAEAVMPDPALIPLEQRRALAGLTEATCRWPYGHPGEPDFFFCGAAPEAGQPYCRGHCAVAYVPRVPK